MAGCHGAPRVTEELWGSDFQTLCFHPISIPNGAAQRCRLQGALRLLGKSNPRLGSREASRGRSPEAGGSDFMGREGRKGYLSKGTMMQKLEVGKR